VGEHQFAVGEMAAQSASSAIGTIARHVSGDRLWDRLMALARFGALPKGGVNRQALSTEEIEARAEVVRWGRAIGLEASTDPVANLFLRCKGIDASLPPVFIGSHIDSQPTGGKFDGAFGVLAALESIEAIIASGARPRRTIDVVAWMNEEGSRYAPGMMGSAVYCGARKLEDILSVRDKAGITVETELKKVLLAEPHLPQRPLGAKPFAFLEAHIEQGPILQNEKKTIGVVTGIQGKRTFQVQVDGEENHAGTSPRSARRDALVSAVNIIDRLQEKMWDREDIVRFTVGMLNVSPNAPSVVPARVIFSLDLRHPDTQRLRELGDKIIPICKQAALKCDVTVTELLHDPPLEFPDALRRRLTAIADTLGIPYMDISSGAGHDARYLHYICPTAMIFIPCKDGISHNEAESATKNDIATGAHVLAEAAFGIANAD
jgi:beta-ureidopropionase / N-carbamoyl-L-amino-acid hydrolase